MPIVQQRMELLAALFALCVTESTVAVVTAPWCLWSVMHPPTAPVSSASSLPACRRSCVLSPSGGLITWLSNGLSSLQCVKTNASNMFLCNSWKWYWTARQVDVWFSCVKSWNVGFWWKVVWWIKKNLVIQVSLWNNYLADGNNIVLLYFSER